MEMFFLCVVFFSIAITRSDSISDKEYAKLPPIFEADNFDRCLLFEDEALYCFVEYHLKPIDPGNSSITWNTIKELSADPKNYRHDNLRHGICVPLSCPNISRSHKDPEFKRDLAGCYNSKYEHLGVHGTIEHAYCQTTEPRDFDFFDGAAAVFLIAYTMFVIYASFYEGSARYKTPEEYKEITSTQYGKLISCFSIIKNWERLTTVDWTPDNVRFRAFQGVRFYNLFIVIALHAVLLLFIGPITNTRISEGMFDNPLSIILASGPYGVSTFFQMSALLLTYTVMKKFNEKSENELNLKTALWILLYRYIRLTPSMAVILLLHSTLLYHAGVGPWWDDTMGIDRRNCRVNGWSNLLYINNWVSPDKMCLSETWYLSVDMQGFILVLALLYFTVKNPRRFWRFLIIGWLLCHIAIIWHLYSKSLFYFMRPYPENMYMLNGIYEVDGTWVNTLSYTPMNLAGTFTGTAVGYLAYKYENIHFLTSKTRYVLWHIFSYGVGLAIIIIPGKWLFSPDYYDSHWFSIPYLTLAPTIYCMAISLGIMVVTTGHGWVTKWVLEWPPLYYLGRISYTAYLAHYSLLFYYISSRKFLISVSYASIFFQTIELLSSSMLMGFLLSLMVEYPISAISSLYLKNKITDETNKDDIKSKIIDGINKDDIKHKLL